MKIYEIVEQENIAETIIRGKTASRHVHYDPLYKGLTNYDGTSLMNDADAIEAMLYGRSFNQREAAFMDLLARKYKITRETDIGALLKSIRDQLEAKNRQHIKDRDAENAKYDDEGNLVADEDISVTEQELDVMSADDSKRMAVKHGGAGRQDVGETTTSGSVAVAVQPVGKMQSRNMYNKDGTMKNALDSDKLMTGKKKSK